ncbi:tetratricopeptide repeat protein [Chloroflexi bacterium TSY]|nr:tetratricopeptide repeat protein [Chloroflexi bacterium TSY]
MSQIELHQILGMSAQLLSQNRADEALEILIPLYEVSPDNLDVAINLGGAYILLQQWRKAVRVLEPASRQYPDNAMIWANLGAAYLGPLETAGPRQQTRAIEAYERAIKADPKAPNVHYHLGLIYADQKKLIPAHHYFQQALDVNPQDRDAQRWLTRITRAIAEQDETNLDPI